MKGRQMVTNILRIEAFAKTLTMVHLFVCMLFLDMASAFPSMSRVFIFRALKKMGAPNWWINAVWFLYDSNYHYILWHGVKYEGFEFCRGVKQGCPLSAILFVHF